MGVDGKLLDCLPSVGMVIVAGGIGSGKSCMAYGILEELHLADPARQIFAYNFPIQKAHLLPAWIHPTLNEEFPDGSAVIVDEAYFAFYAKDHANELNRFMEKFAGLARQKGIFTLFITQATRKVTLAQVAGAQGMLIKTPDIMMTKLDRPELRPMLKEALAAFLKLPPDDRRRATWVLSTEYEGLLEDTNSPPSFWTDELSRAWEGVSLTEPAPLNSRHVICTRCRTDQPEYLEGLCEPCWEHASLKKARLKGFKKVIRGGS